MTSPTSAPESPLLEARGVGRSYRRGRGWLREAEHVQALAGIDLALAPGRVIGLVGASGAGKSSLARCLSLQEPPDSGAVLYRGRDVAVLTAGALRGIRSQIQMVFQNSASSFNPGWSAREALEEPLTLARKLDPAARQERCEELARMVGIEPADLARRARDFSGGQLKRLNLARALSVEPTVLILDEPFSGLDVSLKAQIANLLQDLLRRRSVACLHISHDLSMISRLADEVAVMHGGRIVECGSVAEILTDPAEPPTRALLAASSLAPA